MLPLAAIPLLTGSAAAAATATALPEAAAANLGGVFANLGKGTALENTAAALEKGLATDLSKLSPIAGKLAPTLLPYASGYLSGSGALSKINKSIFTKKKHVYTHRRTHARIKRHSKKGKLAKN